MPAAYVAARRFALAFPGVEEGMAYGTPSLHVRRKLLARLREDGGTLVVKVEPTDRTGFFEREPDTFFTTDHHRDHPVMLVNLLAVQENTLRGIMEGAWRFVASKRAVAAHDAKQGRDQAARAVGGLPSP